MNYREEYDKLASEIASIKSAIESIAAVVHKGNTALSNWRTATLANSGEVEFRELEATSTSRSINIGDWPSGKDIADKLRRYHQLKTMLLSVYSRLSSDEQSPRSAIKPPNDLL